MNNLDDLLEAIDFYEIKPGDEIYVDHGLKAEEFSHWVVTGYITEKQASDDPYCKFDIEHYELECPYNKCITGHLLDEEVKMIYKANSQAKTLLMLHDVYIA